MHRTAFELMSFLSQITSRLGIKFVITKGLQITHTHRYSEERSKFCEKQYLVNESTEIEILLLDF